MIGQPPWRASRIASQTSKTRNYRPKLGQHFLQDQNYQQRILEALDLRREDAVVEIGPGGGALTRLLTRTARRVIAVELDRELATRLEEEFSAVPSLRIIREDILKVDFAEIARQEDVLQLFVFGNLPYYITSPILHQLYDQRHSIRGMGLLMQREVAERLTALPGSRDYGYLTVATQLYTRPEIAFHVPAGAFKPPPKVRSSLVTFRMQPRFEMWTSEKQKQFLEFVKGCFAQKRKNLLNNLSGRYSRQKVEEALQNSRKTASARAEELSVEELGRLYERLSGS
jgi:16S rRNA (adenine1518-N6/adenine1519-N6)-dimethyltransferase